MADVNFQKQVGVPPGTPVLELMPGVSVELGSWIDDRFYGTGQFVTGQTAQLELLTVGKGQPIPGGTRIQMKVDTNVPKAGENGLPTSWEAWVFGIANDIVRVMRAATATANPILQDTAAAGVGSLSAPATLNTLFQFDRLTYVEFDYNGNDYAHGVVQNFPKGHGLRTFSTNANIEIAQNGVESPRDRLAFVIPVHLEAGLGYKMTYQPEAPLVINQVAADGGLALGFLDLKCELNALIKRNMKG